jgi:alkylated DNA repair dioxygenase AlkB
MVVFVSIKKNEYVFIHITMLRYTLSENSWIEERSLSCDIDIDFDELWSMHPIERPILTIFGVDRTTPRWYKSYGRDYKFSGSISYSEPIPDILEEMLNFANNLNLGAFNQILVNWYDNGHDNIGPHSDDERQLVKDSPIVSISFGARRIFRIRKKASKEIALDLPVNNRTFLIMGGKMQSEFTHEVPKITGNKGLTVGRRINITLRQFK